MLPAGVAKAVKPRVATYTRALSTGQSKLLHLLLKLLSRFLFCQRDSDDFKLLFSCSWGATNGRMKIHAKHFSTVRLLTCRNVVGMVLESFSSDCVEANTKIGYHKWI